MKRNQLLIATTNPGKLVEIRRFLSDVPLTLVSLRDVGITDEVEETGETFEENAILKAKFYAQKSGLPTIADDGGLEIDALGGEPGVKTRRWINKDTDSTDEELIVYTIKRLEGVPLEKRQAQLRLVLAFVTSTGVVHLSRSVISGIITLEPSGDRYEGFPFRSLLFLPEIGKYYNHEELTDEENAQYNHRKKALEALKPVIQKILT